MLRNGDKNSRLATSLCAFLLAVLLVVAQGVVCSFGSVSSKSIANAAEVSTQDVPQTSKPKLTKMLADNQHIVLNNYYILPLTPTREQMRADFVVRVRHGQVNVKATNWSNMAWQCSDGTYHIGQSCGMIIRYAYNMNLLLSGAINTLDYKNTMSGKTGAMNWAANQDDCFTIHSVLTAGNYDYLTISVTCALDVTGLTTSAYDVGGSELNQFLWVEVPTVALNSIPPNYGGLYPVLATEQLGVDTDYMTNVLADYPAYIYQDTLCGDNSDGQGCNGPRAMVGWNNKPALWSNGQANWGLVTDFGLTANSTNYNPGVAPPTSFFVKWFNRASASSPCSNTSSYYFQWIGLKDGQWVPVTDLTPHAQLVSQSAINGERIQEAANDNTGFAFNNNNSSLHLRSMQGSGGGLSIAQNADGSIDFARARADQGLDGYFKLVTWPVTNPGDTRCTASTISSSPWTQKFSPRDIFNPVLSQLQNNEDPGISTSMTQTEIATLVNKAWVIDTVFNKYGLPVRPPVITAPAENAYAGLHPTINGTGEPGATINLYAEKDGNLIDPNNPNDPDKAGRLVGTTTVDGSGNWSIVDTGNTKVTGSQRYHATQTATRDSEDITSEFSNIRTVQFAVPSTAPPVTTIDVPHTTNPNGGVLLGTDRVVIHGTASPNSPGETLKVYVRHASDPPMSEGDIISGCTQVLTNAGSQNWSCEVVPSFFTSELAQGEDYVFVAKLVNTTGGVDSGFSADKEQIVDMTAPFVAFDALQPLNTISGTAYLDAAHTVPANGATIHIHWPDNSEDTATVQAGGTWSFSVPSGMTSGQVRVYGIDPQTNESDWIVHELELSAPVYSLPLTGDHSKLVLIIAGIIAALLAIGAGVYAVIDRKMRFGKAAADDP
ncbi:LPXTG cell wall anchor domain-containing protein [Bifidobacterium sp. ESL0784]|uniref:LPXTG cell wall anchor domain-containing protein n=1 Tax=Bifidobacterium sp. ESL0784 TaxID=2983231 RepID=UPI0023F9F762|nr:LPXTG cell wall anchor domain-containing protein [Bifidobacterium sp. ESL0784]MDF7641162.1 LPXTG cell wall anchor domain-containing protein [Bifidobacterium sp. ESL0784]